MKTVEKMKVNVAYKMALGTNFPKNLLTNP